MTEDLTTKDIALVKVGELKLIADELKEFVVKQKLFTNIKGKNYVHIEGWQFAGASLGVLPVVNKVEKTEDGYRAEVRLVDRVNNTVGYGVAICSTKEKGRSSQDEYIIASMAQTRAVGKAYRNGFGWLMKLAGYQATPAEEMTGVFDTKTQLDEVRERVS